MRFVLAMVLAGLAALPLRASAQADETAVPKVALAIHTQHRLPPQLMLRASYYLYEEDTSRLERWHPEAFVDPSKPASEPAPEEPDVDILSQRAIEHHESLSEEKKEQERRKRRGVAIGVPVAVAVVVVAVLLAAAAASID